MQELKIHRTPECVELPGQKVAEKGRLEMQERQWSLGAGRGKDSGGTGGYGHKDKEAGTILAMIIFL